jgi:CBS domain containing-hemolysin-like protein
LVSGDVIRYQGYEFRVEQVERRRVARVRVMRRTEATKLPSPALIREPSI